MNTHPEIILILPNIRSAHNVGAFFRTADAIGVSKIFLTGYTPHPGHPRVDKVSLGAEKVIPWERRTSAPVLLRELRRDGYSIVALEKTATSTDYRDWTPQFPLAIVVGNEVTGVTRQQLALCDSVIHLPMMGTKESLNVSVAFGGLAYAIARFF
jgi:23S rRNA (guanosine2251-2'-O)-methyltransferase